MADQTPILQALNLSKAYHTGELIVHALSKVDLDLHAGELVVLLGPSGSGKSTLLNILGGLDHPSTGSVIFAGDDLARMDDRELTRYRRENVGFVFQFYNLVASLTARENVEVVTEIASQPMPANDALNLVGLGERKNHFPSELSGGEQQRVAIARAIAKRPKILMCDEPTGALDSKTGILVLEAVSQTNRNLGTTTVVITHNVAIADMADRVVVIGDGRIQEVRVVTDKKQPADMSW